MSQNTSVQPTQTSTQFTQHEQHGKPVVHWLPFGIDHAGEADVSNYFEIKSKGTDGSQYASSSVRGYPIQGDTYSFPEPYQLAMCKIVDQPNPPETDGTTTNISPKKQQYDSKLGLKVESVHKQLMWWCWDEEPSQHHNTWKALTWTHVAKQLNNPVTEQQLQQKLELVRANKEIKTEIKQDAKVIVL